MKKLLIYMATIMAFLLTMVANAGAASASNFIFCEPQVPFKLRK